MDLKERLYSRERHVARTAVVGGVSRGQKKVHLRFIDGAWLQ